MAQVRRPLGGCGGFSSDDHVPSPPALSEGVPPYAVYSAATPAISASGELSSAGVPTFAVVRSGISFISQLNMNARIAKGTAARKTS